MKAEVRIDTLLYIRYLLQEHRIPEQVYCLRGKFLILNHYFVYHIEVPVLVIPDYQFREEECGSGADQRTPTSGKSPKKSWTL